MWEETRGTAEGALQVPPKPASDGPERKIRILTHRAGLRMKKF